MASNSKLPIEYTFGRGQILPRTGSILKSPPTWLSAGLATATSYFLPQLPIAELKVMEVASIGLSFAALAIAGCFTAAVLALALPGENRIKKWSNARGELQHSSAYSDLIFVLVWAGISQLALIAVCVCGLIFGGTRPVFPPGAPLWQFGSAFVAAFLFYYAVLELFIVIKTLMVVALVINHEESQGP